MAQTVDDRLEALPRAGEARLSQAREPAEAPLRVQCRESRKILFVNQYYWPDRASTAQHLCDLAESLAAEGHEVHVLCGRGSSKPAASRFAHALRRAMASRFTASARRRWDGRARWKRMTDYLSFLQ